VPATFRGEGKNRLQVAGVGCAAAVVGAAIWSNVVGFELSSTKYSTVIGFTR
jgi:hypothetical protein